MTEQCNQEMICQEAQTDLNEHQIESKVAVYEKIDNMKRCELIRMVRII
jgi:hypothetical protein